VVGHKKGGCRGTKRKTKSDERKNAQQPLTKKEKMTMRTTHKTVLIGALWALTLAVALPHPAQAQPAPDLTGRWLFTYDYQIDGNPQSAMTVEYPLAFSMQGDGTFFAHQYVDLPICNHYTGQVYFNSPRGYPVLIMVERNPCTRYYAVWAGRIEGADARRISGSWVDLEGNRGDFLLVKTAP
jgi:hypothetical protein